MKHLLEVHILQNFAPSNLNRDDTGSPKDAIFGGFRRGRISSQCLKRSAREYARDENLLAPSEMALRSKRIVQDITDRLVAKGRDETESAKKVVVALGGVGLKVGDDQKTQYLVFLGDQELNNIADRVDEHWDSLTVQEDSGKKGKEAKKAAKDALPENLSKALKGVLDGGKAVDVALFGRMLADMPQANKEAACQVAHAISTHSIEREFDFYTAVDDLQPEDNSGADMLGTIEFNSACFYRYAALNVTQLIETLQNDRALAIKGIRAFLKAMVKAKPSGKQNTFAAHNDPEFVVFTVRQDADPRNLANAFEKPVKASARESLTEVSAERFIQKWQKMEAAYGQSGTTFTLNLTDLEKALGEQKHSFDELVEATVQQIEHLLGD